MPRHAYYLTLLACLCFVNTFAQSYHFRNYTIEDGLPSNEVYQCIQDRQGYMWFATDRGVSRYDGYAFTNYITEDNLPDNTVFDFYEDYKGRIWFYCFNGKMGFYEDGRIIRLESPVPFPNHTTGFRVDSTDKVEATFLGGHYASFQLENDRIAPSSIVLLNDFDKDDVLDTLKQKGLAAMPIRWQGKSRFWVKINEDTMTFCYPSSFLYLNRQLDTLMAFEPEADTHLMGFIADDKGHRLLTQNGMAIPVSPDGPDLDNVQRFAPKGARVSGYFQDALGGLWITSDNSGIYYSPNLSLHRFTVLPEVPGTGLTYFQKKGDTCMFTNKDGKLWIATAAGLELVYDFKKHIKKLIEVEGHFFLPGFLNGPYYDGKSIDSLARKGRVMFSDLIYTDGHLWGVEGDILWDIEWDHSTHISKVVKRWKVPETRRMVTLKLHEDTLWFGAMNGLFAFDRKEGKLLPQAKNPLLHERVVDLATNNQQLIIATRGAGLLIKDGANVDQIHKSDGLISNLLNNVILDGDSIIWVSSTTGASKIRIQSYSPLRYTIENFTYWDGVLSQSTNKVYLHEDSIYFISNKGITSMHKATEKPKHRPPILMQNITINHQDTTLLDHYELSYSQNSLTISFTGFDFSFEHNLSYKYRLGNEDTVWTYTNNRSVNFPSLSAGSYTFEVVAINPDGIESESPVGFSFRIAPPFWETVWFWCLIATTVLILLVGMFQRRVKRIRQESRMKASLHELESKALNAQMNPHFIHNALTAVQNYILKNEKIKAYDFMAKFAGLIRAILDNSEHPEVAMSEDIKLLTLYLELEKERFGDKFEFSIIIDKDINPHAIKVPSMLIQPYAENAIRHGIMHLEKDGLLRIQFSKINDLLRCTIEDNGVGRSPNDNRTDDSHAKRPHAMSINKRRLEVLSQLKQSPFKVEVVDVMCENQPAGTKVLIDIPLKNDDD